MDVTELATGTPLEDIAFLARSDNRVRALDELTRGDRSRRELHEETGISQPTLGRILDGFEEREWVSYDPTNGRQYSLTPFGALMAAEFEELLDAAETIARLRELADHLPLSEMDFDLRLFADATITVPSRTDAVAHMRREDELADGADHIRFLCSSAFPPTIRAYRDRVVDGGKTLEAVITGDALDAAASDPETAAVTRELVGAEGATVYRYEDSVSLMMGVIDHVASVVPLDDNGAPCAFIETENPTIRRWVEDRLDEYEERATPITTESFPEPPFTG